jgi:hypothetical protein
MLHQDWKQRPMPFQGDEMVNSPPLAWTVIWKETYSPLYGQFIPEELRRWGYVFWDASTLKSVGGLGLLERQWDSSQDPRLDIE